MNRFDALQSWWQLREPRERTMLLVMLAALAAFALWLGMFLLQRAAANARAHHDRAAAVLAEVESAAQAITVLQERRPAPPAADAFAGVVLAAAATGEVSVSRRRTDDAGVLTLGIDAVTAPVLMAWLDDLHRQHGLAPQALDIHERNGRLQVEVAFAPATP